MKFENLRKLREGLSMTQEQFADSLGLSKTTYNGYETGARDPKSIFWCRVADKYNVTVDFLLGVKNTSPVAETANELCAETLQVAHAYEAADSGTKGAVRKLLDVDKPSGRIEKELASYRLELEAEEEAKRLSASETIGASTETRKMA